jgi:8-oxo-dGTP diphosphatase
MEDNPFARCEEKGIDLADLVIEANYCLRCGHPMQDRFVFGQMRRACPACCFIFFQQLKVGAGVLVEHEGRVLLGRRSVEPGYDCWCFPAGFVEYDEPPEKAALRECKEETGLDVRITGLLDVFYYADDFRGAGILILYKAEVVGGELVPDDDLSEARFFGPDELPEDIAFVSNRQALERWRESRAAKTSDNLSWG